MRLVWSLVPPEDTPQARLAAYPKAPRGYLRCEARGAEGEFVGAVTTTLPTSISKLLSTLTLRETELLVMCGRPTCVPVDYSALRDFFEDFAVVLLGGDKDHTW